MLTGDLGLFVSETISRELDGSGVVEGIDELKRLGMTDGDWAITIVITPR